MNWRGGIGGIKVLLPLVALGVCLFGFMLHRQSGIFREFEAAFLSLQCVMVAYFGFWCAVILFLTFSLKDLWLIGLLLITILVCFAGQTDGRRGMDAIMLLFGTTLGKGARCLLYGGSRRESAQIESGIKSRESGSDQSGLTSAASFLIGLVLLLTFSSWWHLDMTSNVYQGPRWMGLWNNPNDYGILMAAGVLLTIGLLATRQKEEVKRKKLLSVILFIAAFMMGVGLVMSYSRGAWVATAIGLLYMAKVNGKFKWRWVLPPVLAALVVVCFFWNNTSENAPWFVKRMDLSRASAQHRVAAWKAGFQIMRDHPFGAGWNKAVETYEKNYSPPENGAVAITTNDYLMLGTQLGIPALLCFVVYVGLCFSSRELRISKSRHYLTLTLSPPAGSGEGMITSPVTRHVALQTACRAGALAMLVAFWFDGGLFKLATASVFWVLLELGKTNAEGTMKNEETRATSGIAETNQREELI